MEEIRPITVSGTLELADRLAALPREGADVDEPEGARFIRMSDTLARRIERFLRELAPLDPAQR